MGVGKKIVEGRCQAFVDVVVFVVVVVVVVECEVFLEARPTPNCFHCRCCNLLQMHTV
jgi:hypothetical protein